MSLQAVQHETREWRPLAGLTISGRAGSVILDSTSNSTNMARAALTVTGGSAGSLIMNGTSNTTNAGTAWLDWSTTATPRPTLGVAISGWPEPEGQYNSAMVSALLQADAEEPEAKFNNVVDMLDWLK